MNTRYNSLFQFVFTFLDISCLNFAFAICMFYSKEHVDDNGASYLMLFIVVNTAWVISCALSRLYINTNYFQHGMFLTRTIKAMVLYTVAVYFFVFFYRFDIADNFVMKSTGYFFGSLILVRILFIVAGEFSHLQDKLVKKVIIIGYNDSAKKLADHFSLNSNKIMVDGYFEEYEKVQELSAYPIIGNVKAALNYAINNRVSEIYSTLASKDYPFLYNMAEEAENNFIRFKFVPDFNVFAEGSVHVNYLENIPVLSLRNEPLEEVGNRIMKRGFDIVFSFLVIVFLLSWLFPILAIIIKLDSKGPVFFNQNRLGRDLKKIKVFKFRSMKTTEADTQFKQATKDDPRITKVGRILRKTSLDELPQFFNVLLGTMSIVGPRPHPLKMNDDYKQIINKYMIRHFLKPGITGWAQVNGFRGETKTVEDIQGRISLDIWYMENWAFFLDLKIIYLTVYNIIKGEKNAY